MTTKLQYYVETEGGDIEAGKRPTAFYVVERTEPETEMTRWTFASRSQAELARSLFELDDPRLYRRLADMMDNDAIEEFFNLALMKVGASFFRLHKEDNPTEDASLAFVAHLMAIRHFSELMIRILAHGKQDYAESLMRRTLRCIIANNAESIKWIGPVPVKSREVSDA